MKIRDYYKDATLRLENCLIRKMRDENYTAENLQDLKAFVLAGKFDKVRNAGLKTNTELFAILTALTGYDEQLEAWLCKQVAWKVDAPNTVIIQLYDLILYRLERNGYNLHKNNEYPRIMDFLTEWETEGKTEDWKKCQIHETVKSMVDDAGGNFLPTFVEFAKSDIWVYF